MKIRTTLSENTGEYASVSPAPEDAEAQVWDRSGRYKVWGQPGLEVKTLSQKGGESRETKAKSSLTPDKAMKGRRTTLSVSLRSPVNQIPPLAELSLDEQG